MLRVTLLTALLAAGAATAQPLTLHVDGADPADEQGLITREWVWSEGTSTTTFTARGPSDQVNQLDPRDRTPECQGCELARSTYFEPVDEVEAD